MKSEERHELQKNELDKVANRAISLYDCYQNQILWGIVVVLLGMAGWIYIVRSSRVAAESAWTDLEQAGAPAEYLDVSSNFPKSSAAGVAKLQAALAMLETGVRASFSDREQANVQLKDARRAFEELIEVPNLDKNVREQALYGLAQTLESISGGDTEAAVKAYENLLKEFPESLYKEQAEFRIADLKKPGTQEFLAWYQKQNPKPPEQPKPQDGQGPGANVGAPLPGSEVGGLGLPAPPPPSGAEDIPAGALGGEIPAGSEAKPAEETKPADNSEPVEPDGPALPTAPETSK